MPNTRRREELKAQLLSLDYPWPDYLEHKSLSWLDAEIRAVNPPDDKADRQDSSSSRR